MLVLKYHRGNISLMNDENGTVIVNYYNVSSYITWWNVNLNCFEILNSERITYYLVRYGIKDAYLLLLLLLMVVLLLLLLSCDSGCSERCRARAWSRAAIWEGPVDSSAQVSVVVHVCRLLFSNPRKAVV